MKKFFNLLLLLIMVSLMTACQKQQLPLAGIDEPKNQIDYQQEVIFNDAAQVNK